MQAENRTRRISTRPCRDGMRRTVFLRGNLPSDKIITFAPEKNKGEKNL
jgi:hypothetical protein